ncbi:MAG: NAD-dependent protein deacetylase [Thermoanaerobaculia bacterium]
MDALARVVASSRRLLALTGAGCSTESGIPDYRGPDGTWKHKQPMLYQEFVSSEVARKRYWARSMAGWQRIEAARPNDGHRALARLETAGALRHVVTQNVDGLHGKAGSRRVIDLHGRLDRVECLLCRVVFPRREFQRELERLNPEWPARVSEVQPDGDADLGVVDYESFRVPACPCCAGDLKPAVVFFGESVPPGRTARALRLLEEADALLVAGSSLMVWSGYRFVRRAAARRIPVALVGLGRTRGDGEATLKVEGRCGEVLPELATRIAGTGP